MPFEPDDDLVQSLLSGRNLGVVGSDTSTHTLVVDLVGAARIQSINGRMVVVVPHDSTDEREYALGTVTEIVNHNRFHEDPALRGVVAMRGSIRGLSGRGDIKTAKVQVQSVFRRSGEQIRPVGSSMTFAAATGEPVYLATPDIIESLARESTPDLFFVGDLYRQPGVPLPLSVHDYSGARGAESAAFLGPSGCGKTTLATYFIGSMLRHLDMGFLLVDPQGQFSTDAKVERELPLDIRSLADAQGREVVQLSVARQVRLPEDPDLFVQMLGTTPFFRSNRHLAVKDRQTEVKEMCAAWLSEEAEWSDRPHEDLLLDLVRYLMGIARTGGIYVGIKESDDEDDDLPVDLSVAGNRTYHNLRSVLYPEEYDPAKHDGHARRKNLLQSFSAILALFSEGATGGGVRRKITDIVGSVTDVAKRPRPLFVLALSDQESGHGDAARALESEEAQTIILRTLLSRLEDTARWRYQETDSPANVMVVLEEAARFASVKERRRDQEFAEDLARYGRELRKYAVGITYILQEPSTLHPSIWKQLRNGFRAFAAGLVGNDLDLVREQVGSSGALRLYSQLAQPTKDNPMYPFMLCGSISPLSVSSAPLFMEVFSGADAASRWAEANKRWLPAGYQPDDVWHGHSTRT